MMHNYPLCDKTGCIELNCPAFLDRTGCTCGQLVELLEVSGEKPCMRDQGTSGAHEPHRLRGRTCPSHLRAAGPRIFLTAPLSSVPVGFPSGPRERRLRCGTRAIRAALQCAPPVQGEAPELWWRTPDASRPGS